MQLRAVPHGGDDQSETPTRTESTSRTVEAIDLDLGPRDLVAVSGPDATTYLQSQLSQDIVPLSVGESAWTYVLTPTGKIVSLARVSRSEEHRYVLDTDAGYGDQLVERLNMFKIRVDVDIDVDYDRPAPTTGHHETGHDEQIEAQRIRAGWPKMGAEIVSGETIPAGLGLNDVAVSFTKGCYPGQELVERMDSRDAEAPRTLRVVDVAPGAHAGDPVIDDVGTEIGVLTSVADGRALAWIRRGAGKTS